MKFYYRFNTVALALLLILTLSSVSCTDRYDFKKNLEVEFPGMVVEAGVDDTAVACYQGKFYLIENTDMISQITTPLFCLPREPSSNGIPARQYFEALKNKVPLQAENAPVGQ